MKKANLNRLSMYKNDNPQESTEEIRRTEEDNKALTDENILIDKNYVDLQDRYTNNSDYYKSKILEYSLLILE